MTRFLLNVWPNLRRFVWPTERITEACPDPLLINANLKMVRETRRVRTFIAESLGQEQADLVIPESFLANIYGAQA
jgi:hypothetical protein